MLAAGCSRDGGSDVEILSPLWSIPHDSSRQLAAYWTAARVRAAKPFDRTVARGPLAAAAEQPDAAPSLTVPPRSPERRFRSVGAAPPDVQTCTRVEQDRVCWSRFAWTGDTRQLPTRTIGKITFDRGGKPFACSGAAVTSRNESVVWTAGHCVLEEGVLHENWAFAPGYRDGEAPFGWWRPRDSSSMFVPKEWREDENEAYDFAAVVVEPNAGATLGDAVGSQGIRFAVSPADEVLVFGYPAEKPYDGGVLYACRSLAPKWLRDPPEGRGTPTLGVGCDQPEGASGGPFVSGTFQGVLGWGWVISNVSYGWRGFDELTFGPYLGPEAQELWSAAEAR
jgi:hypothetical protein